MHTAPGYSYITIICILVQLVLYIISSVDYELLALAAAVLMLLQRCGAV
jgi:hypothetical protein